MAEHSSEQTTAATRHSLYIEDGDIVLSVGEVAHDTAWLFRIHRGLLAYHSPVFRDMLSLGPHSSDMQYDGVPLVHIPGDNSEDFAELLMILYDPSALHVKLMQNNTDIAFHLTGLMGLADKYLIDTIRIAIIAHVRSTWPTTLSEWDHVEECTALAAKTGLPYDRILPEPLAAIQFANMFNVPEILPAAFYYLSTISMEHDRDSQLPKTGVTLKEQPSARWSILDRQGLFQFITGRDRLHDRAFELASRNAVSYPCPGTHHPCPEARKALPGELLQCFVRETEGPRDPLGAFKTLEKTVSRNNWFCSKCKQGLSRKLLRPRESLWNELPQFFNFELYFDI